MIFPRSILALAAVAYAELRHPRSPATDTPTPDGAWCAEGCCVEPAEEYETHVRCLECGRLRRDDEMCEGVYPPACAWCCPDVHDHTDGAA